MLKILMLVDRSFQVFLQDVFLFLTSLAKVELKFKLKNKLRGNFFSSLAVKKDAILQTNTLAFVLFDFRPHMTVKRHYFFLCSVLSVCNVRQSLTFCGASVLLIFYLSGEILYWCPLSSEQPLRLFRPHPPLCFLKDSSLVSCLFLSSLMVLHLLRKIELCSLSPGGRS